MVSAKEGEEEVWRNLGVRRKRRSVQSVQNEDSRNHYNYLFFLVSFAWVVGKEGIRAKKSKKGLVTQLCRSHSHCTWKGGVMSDHRRQGTQPTAGRPHELRKIKMRRCTHMVWVHNLTWSPALLNHAEASSTFLNPVTSRL